MSSRRRSRSRDRTKAPGTSKLRMDSKPQTPRISDPSLPSGRRREIDNVMKKARASPNSNNYWDKKLLEVEAKDPNRWRHSGYKSMYIDGSSSPSSGHRSRSRSLPPRRSPPQSLRRSPVMRDRRSPRSPISRRSPPPSMRRSPVMRDRRSPPISRRSPPMAASRRSPVGRVAVRPRSPYAHHAHARNPPVHRRSPSASSLSSCSDDSCSVCSRNNSKRSNSPVRRTHAQKQHPKTQHKKAKVVRPPSPSPPPARRPVRPMTPPPTRRPMRPAPSASSSDKPTDPRRQPPPPRPRNRAGDIIDVSGVKPPPPKGTKKIKEKEPVLLTRIKKERTGPSTASSGKKRAGSPGGESSVSDDSSESSTSAIVATTRLSLSERFGKMAQWSVDRERRDIENMRITKTGGDLKVMIEEDDFLYGSPPPPHRYSISPVPAGHFPDELMGGGNASRMAGWDDVRVRYQYYKDLGYLRDLTMDDYVKWEEWWYKYQDWLANERNYEHWVATQGRSERSAGSGSGRRRRKLPASQRLN